MTTKDSTYKHQSKILIVYYTRSGNTEIFANQIKKLVGGDLFRIEEVNKYPPSYQEVLKISKVEIQNKIKPPIQETVENIEKYDIIFVGTPNWYGTMAPPVTTFLSLHDLSNKKIIPFATHGGGGVQQCLIDIGTMISQAIVLEGIAFYGSQAETSTDRILTWLKKMQLFNNLLNTSND